MVKDRSGLQQPLIEGAVDGLPVRKGPGTVGRGFEDQLALALIPSRDGRFFLFIRLRHKGYFGWVCCVPGSIGPLNQRGVQQQLGRGRRINFFG